MLSSDANFVLCYYCLNNVIQFFDQTGLRKDELIYQFDNPQAEILLCELRRNVFFVYSEKFPL